MQSRFARPAALAACLGAGVACAQSVTLFGVADVAARHIDNGGVRQTMLSPDGNTPSRLGFRGVEDLGAGLSASFWLEAGISMDSGSMPNPTKFFHRRSTVSLASASAGELRLGRDYTPTFMGYVLYDPFYTSGVGAAFNVLAGPGLSNGSGAMTTVRADNAVQYFTPAGLGGWHAQVMMAAGEGVPGSNYKGLRGGYADGAIDASVAHGVTDAATGKYTISTLGGSWKAGAWKLGVVGIRTAFGARREAVLLVGGNVTIATGEVRMSYVHKNAKGGGTDANDASQLAIGYVHQLSRRTAIYATAARLVNKGASASTVSIGSAAAPGRPSTGHEVGFRHVF